MRQRAPSRTPAGAAGQTPSGRLGAQGGRTVIKHAASQLEAMAPPQVRVLALALLVTAPAAADPETLSGTAHVIDGDTW